MDEEKNSDNTPQNEDTESKPSWCPDTIQITNNGEVQYFKEGYWQTSFKIGDHLR